MDFDRLLEISPETHEFQELKNKYENYIEINYESTMLFTVD